MYDKGDKIIVFDIPEVNGKKIPSLSAH